MSLFVPALLSHPAMLIEKFTEEIMISNIFFSEVSLPESLQDVWSWNTVCLRKKVFCTWQPKIHTKRTILDHAGGDQRALPEGTPTGQVAGWLISHLPLPLSKNTQNLPGPMSNSSFAKYDLGARGPRYSATSRSQININLLLKEEGPWDRQHWSLPPSQHSLNNKKNPKNKQHKTHRQRHKNKNKQQKLGHGTSLI